ncbi:MAG: Asp/Glu racemase [Desulfuromonadales bacterium]|nr:Asp/Glu racemase [Desulfuromonadales bacterium]
MEKVRNPISVETVKVPVQMDKIAPLGRIGLLALATDFNSEQDLRRMLPEGLEIFTNRIKNANPTTIENLRTMAGDITRAAAGILPELGVDAMIYGCTSGTIAIGTEKLNELIHAAWPGIPTTNPIVAAQAAFDAFGASRLSVLTPYIDEVNEEMARYFLAQGHDLLNIAGFGFENDIEMTSISPETLLQAAQEVCDERADLLFISCTALRASLAIERIEQALGKPVVTSNQALCWHVLQLLGHELQVPGFGSLFTKGLKTG